MNNEYIILPSKPDTGPRTTITRSWGFKLNCENYGGPRFESRDFFCCQSAECNIEDSERVSQMLYDFCKSQVMRAVREYREEAQQALNPTHPAAKSNAAEFERRKGLDRPSDDYNQLKARIR